MVTSLPNSHSTRMSARHTSNVEPRRTKTFVHFKYKQSSQPQTHTFQVTMTCAGCSGAVERVLKRVPGKGVLCASLFQGS